VPGALQEFGEAGGDNGEEEEGGDVAVGTVDAEAKKEVGSG
jgi:hypothetical protein